MYSDDKIKEIEKIRKEWEKKNLAKFTKNGERLERFETASEIPLESVYTPQDNKDLDYFDDLGFPGTYPFTRGVYPNMYRGRLWTMRQYSGFADASQTNERFKYLLSQGQKGLSIAFDLPSQMGYDSTNQICMGEVGKIGVTINTLHNFEKVFEGIPLDKVSTSMTINAPTAILLAMYIAIGEKQGVKPEHLRGTVQNDILKEYVARGTYIYPPEPSLKLVADVIEYCSNNLPNMNTISISGYHMREAGCTAVQEIAFTLADGIAYVEEVIKRGIDVDEFASRLSFFFACHNNFFEEVAKFRAARRLWARIMKNRFQAKKSNSMRLRFHTQTAGVTLTAQQPNVNMIRTTVQALAAVLGGTQSLHVCGADEALSLPTEDSVRLSLRTQQVLAHESGVTDVVDPLGGSFYVEYLTNKLEEEANKYITRIDEMGGITTAIERGFIQQEIQNKAYSEQKMIENGTLKRIGVNIHLMEEDTKMETFKYDEKAEKHIKESLIDLKKNRDNALVQNTLEEIKKVAKSSDNVMPPIINAVKAYATIQEICDVFREVYGEYESAQVF